MNNEMDNTKEVSTNKYSGSRNQKKHSSQQNNRRRNIKIAPETSISSDSSTCSSGWSSSSESSLSSASSSSRPKTSNRQKKQQKRKNNRKEKSNRPTSTPYDYTSQFVALDCEMAGVGPNGQKSELAQVTIIDWYGNVLLNEYVKPDSEVTDYRTFVSGITKEHLEQHAKLNSSQCRRIVSDILRNKILIGHALENDLRALDIDHPWYQIRDTARYEPFMKVRFNDGILWPRKLKDLSRERLQREMQVVGKPHSPYEDALAALDLYKLVQAHWERAIEYKKMMAVEAERQQQYLSLMQERYYVTAMSNSQQPTGMGYGVPVHFSSAPRNTYGSGGHFHSVQPQFVTIS